MEPDQRKKTIYPRSPADFSKLPQVVANYVTPNKKFRIINKNTKIITQGSCFAENIHLYLSKIGYSSTYNKILEAMNSPLANYNHLIRVSKTPDSKEFE
jgi:hypothetical protein